MDSLYLRGLDPAIGKCTFSPSVEKVQEYENNCCSMPRSYAARVSTFNSLGVDSHKSRHSMSVPRLYPEKQTVILDKHLLSSLHTWARARCGNPTIWSQEVNGAESWKNLCLLISQNHQHRFPFDSKQNQKSRIQAISIRSLFLHQPAIPKHCLIPSARAVIRVARCQKAISITPHL